MPGQQSEPGVLGQQGLVKICGLSQPDHALAAAGAGADLLGLMFAHSKRQVTIEQARAVVEEVRREYGDRAPLFAGVFVDPDAAGVNMIASRVGLDLVQLHGSESADLIHDIALPVIRAVGPPPGSTVDSVLRKLNDHQAREDAPALFLLDAYDPVQLGGSGRLADWALASDVARRVALLLAGGLTVGNVGEAIRQVQPRGVDVSTGVETDGIKDPRKIQEFVTNAKQAFCGLG